MAIKFVFTFCLLVSTWGCSGQTKSEPRFDNNENVGGVCGCECPDGSDGWEYCPGSDGCQCADMGDMPDVATEMSDDLARVADDVLLPAFGADALNDLDRCGSGVAVIVTPDGRLVRGYGATEADGDQLPDGRSLYQIGSLTKVFTGIVMARLEVGGQLDAHQPAAALLSDDVGGGLPAEHPTLGELITHHAGLPPFPTNLVDRDQDGMRDASIDPLSPATGYSRENLVDFLESWTMTPNAGYRYSNVGIGLAALAMQDRAESGFHVLLNDLLLEDLGMNSTWGEVAAIPADETGRIVQGYATNDSGIRRPGRPGQMGVLAGAGEIVLSGDDMAKFLAAATRLDETPLAMTFEHAFTPVADGPAEFEMGYGIELEHAAEGDIMRKGGNTSSYAAYLMFRPATSTGVAVMTSCGGFMVRPIAEQLFVAIEGR